MDIQKNATYIVTKLATAGYIAYFAGGWVRDFVMQHPSLDIDIATNAPPQVILDLFPRTIPVGLAFGVVIVVVEGHPYEVTTFRKDLAYEDGRKPIDIELSDPRQDALRRDFTINGMFYDPIKEVIIDYVGGAEDIKKGIIRTIGDPQERFREDRLRMIRAVRFAARFRFKIDVETQDGIVENADTLFPAVAMERIWQEFKKITHFDNIDYAMIEMHRLHLLQEIFPTLQHVHLNTIKQRVAAYKFFPKNCPTIFYILQLFQEFSLEQQLELCDYLKISGQEKKIVECCYALRMLCAQKDPQHTNPVAWAYALSHPQAQLCLQVIAAGLPAEAQTLFINEMEAKTFSLANHIERIQRKKPLISATMLIEMGISPGKHLGALLKEAERIAITNNINEPDEILKIMSFALQPRKTETRNHA